MDSSTFSMAFSLAFDLLCWMGSGEQLCVRGHDEIVTVSCFPRLLLDFSVGFARSFFKNEGVFSFLLDLD